MPKKQNEEIECKLCGQQFDLTETFCPNCGEEINKINGKGNGDDDDNDDDKQGPFKSW